MAQIIASFESTRDTGLLKSLIENLKGVTNVHFFYKESVDGHQSIQQKKEWIEKMLKLSND